MNIVLDLMLNNKRLFIVDTMIEELSAKTDLYNEIEQLEDDILVETEYLQQEKNEEVEKNLKNLKLKQHKLCSEVKGEKYDCLEKLKILKDEASEIFHEIIDLKEKM